MASKKDDQFCDSPSSTKINNRSLFKNKKESAKHMTNFKRLPTHIHVDVMSVWSLMCLL